MQTDYKQIYKELSLKSGKPEQLYKDIGTFVFQETTRMMKNPTSLIIKLKGIGNWHLRRKRMMIVIEEDKNYEDEKDLSEFETESSYENYKDRHKRYHIFKERLKEYDDYISLRNEIRLKRWETQFPLSPNEDEKFKSE